MQEFFVALITLIHGLGEGPSEVREMPIMPGQLLVRILRIKSSFFQIKAEHQSRSICSVRAVDQQRFWGLVNRL